jgi:hypothetical protein
LHDLHYVLSSSSTPPQQQQQQQKHAAGHMPQWSESASGCWDMMMSAAEH